jgi:hypothetical protein
MRASLLLLIILVQSIYSKAQDISGSWTGIYSVIDDKEPPSKVVVELALYNDSLLTGASHFYYGNGDHVHYALSGQYFRKDSSIYIREDSTIELGRNAGAYCRGSYVMKLTLGENVMRFEGRRKPLGGAFGMEDCPTINAKLEKSMPTKLAPPKLVKRKDKILDRKEELQSQLQISQEERDSIKVELIDNAQIDNDVVSVFLNDDPILRRHKLTAQPAAFWLTLGNDYDVAHIRMAAESMGSIPPCTALMIVTTKKNRYSITLSSDMGNTGMLKLFLKE